MINFILDGFRVEMEKVAVSEKAIMALAALGGLGTAAGLGTLIGHNSKLEIDDIEDSLGHSIRGKGNIRATEEEIEKAKEKSLGLKYPKLTGMGTLGLWPVISNINAQGKIARHLLRTSGSVQKDIEKANKVHHEREKELMPKRIQEEKSRTHRHMAGLAASSVLGLADKILAGKEQD